MRSAFLLGALHAGATAPRTAQVGEGPVPMLVRDGEPAPVVGRRP